MYLYLSFLLVLLFMDSVLHFLYVLVAKARLRKCVVQNCESDGGGGGATTTTTTTRRKTRPTTRADLSLSLSLSLSLLNECVKSQQKGEHKRDDDAPLQRGVEDFCVPTTNKREIKKTTDDQKTTTTPTTTPKATHHVS